MRYSLDKAEQQSKKEIRKMKRIVRVAATQMKCDWETSSNIARAEELVREAHGKGAQIILLQELFRTVYFCQVKENNSVELILGDSHTNIYFLLGARW
jgi:predicted amidohydrolase